jgi:hypothetical protein
MKNSGKYVILEPVAKVGYFCTGSCSFSPTNLWFAGCKTAVLKRLLLQNFSFATASLKKL